MIGNDLVALETISSHPRFFSRISSDEERLIFLNPSLLQIGTLWACKEAAYKAIKKKDPSVSFIPREFICNASFTECQHKGIWVDLSISQTGAYVHAIGITRKSFYRQCLFRVIPFSGESESIEVRKLALELLKEMGYPECSIEGIPPSVIQNHQILNRLQVSLSHDGGYLAAAVAL